MLHYKDIEKVHPLILFFIFVLALTSVLPLVFYAPVPSQTKDFVEPAGTGKISVKLESNRIFFTLVISSVQDPSIFSNRHVIELEMTINTLETSLYDFITHNLTVSSFPLKFTGVDNLTSSEFFSQSINIQIVLSILSTTHTIYNFQVGRIDLPLYARWTLITLFFSIIAFYIPIRLYKKRNANYSLLTMAKSFFRFSYQQYENFLETLNTNELSIFFAIPYILLFSFLNIYYTNYSRITESSFLFYNLKNDVFILLIIHLYLVTNSPIIINSLVDRYSDVSRLIKKSYQKNSLIMLPVYTVFYAFIALISTIFLNQLALFLLIFVSAVFNVGIYYITLKYHCSKYHYEITNRFIFKTIIGYRIGYTIILFIVSLLFLFTTSSFPSYLILI